MLKEKRAQAMKPRGMRKPRIDKKKQQGREKRGMISGV